ncbi:UDP-N-acetylmuramoyl-tripeptide--D-alanyl-D-alanine ligase [Sediminibacillus halophilus]|uniref:UDP-N-acetylmuramoyl-tripeptide--D-alanyl-D-alanine ligase n=1 Tax=Sediminibacillus halophilus TaxID=482461 RepID=A0A1G9MS30_9BACI|nr:UDP-N-acetylmuramoyl-tripeptide--D-alanyl-D-alanine ligase [Sediminibacillus halophilus]SDL76913.1 UDP-N-acetylmuramoyl-tripeptide--D-alanyl-D-alanine ligase [Sediminibacillus halophilus]
MLFTTEFLADVFDDCKGAVQDGIEINEVITDSRRQSHKSLFIPLVGESFDGHDFLKGAFDNGAVAILWAKDRELPEFLPAGFPVFYVDDTLEGLQLLAREYRKRINPTVIGITGSNGKTTTKDLVGTVTGSYYRTHRTKGNLNNHIGVPLTILSMPPQTEVLVLEMGMSGFGEIELLSKIAEPDYAVITNIGESHIEYLGSREGIAQAKSEILAGLKSDGRLFIDGDEALLSPLKQREDVIGCGFQPHNQITADHIRMYSDKTTFQFNGQIAYELNMLGEHNVKNALFAIAIANQLGIPEQYIKSSLSDLELTGMRFEFMSGRNHSTIINDAYNASPTSMKASINVVQQLAGYQRKVLVLGDIFELGEQASALHRQVAAAINQEIDVLFTVGSNAREISDAKQNELRLVQHFDSLDDLTTALLPLLEDGTLVLLKASRGMKLETMLKDIAKQ